MTTHVRTTAPARRGLRAAVLLSAPAGVLLTTPAHADVPLGWSDPAPVDGLHALLLLAGGPLLLIVVISLLVYVPSMVRGERLLPDHSGGEGQWLGGPNSGTRELPAPEADADESRTGGASGSW